MPHNSIPKKTTRPLGTSAKAGDGVFLCRQKPLKSENANNTLRQQGMKPNKVARSCAPLGKLVYLMIH